MGSNQFAPWSEREDRIVARHRPAVATRMLAGKRTYKAIIQRRFDLKHPSEAKVRSGRHCWSPEDVAQMRAHYPIVAHASDMKRYLPEHTVKQIIGKAHQLGLKRKYMGDPRLRGQHELVDQVRIRAKQDGISFQKLDRELKSGWYFQCGYQDTKSVNLRHVAAAVAYFGGTLVIDWHDR